MSLKPKSSATILKKFKYNYDAKADFTNTVVSSWEDIFTPSTTAADKCTVTECKYFKGACTATSVIKGDDMVKPKWALKLKQNKAGIPYENYCY